PPTPVPRLPHPARIHTPVETKPRKGKVSLIYRTSTAACRPVCRRSRMGCLRTREGSCHGYCGADCSRFGVHQRTVYRFFEAGKPLAHGGGTEEGEGGVRARIPDVAEREESDHHGKTNVHEPFAPLGNHRR